MSSLDMSEAVRMLANEKNISVDALLQVLADALALAYKRRPGAAEEVVVEVNPDTFEFKFMAYDVDEDGLWVNERDDTPRKEVWQGAPHTAPASTPSIAPPTQELKAA